jgi:DNA-binding transcriptional MerR regulator
VKPILLITAAQFAAALGVTRRTVNSWTEKGQLVPAMKPNPHLHLYDARDVEKFRIRAKPGPKRRA